MAEEILDQLNVGLSEEEKTDLENMIKAFKEESTDTLDDLSLKDLQEKFGTLNDHMVQMGQTILKFDRRMRAFHEIIRLFYEKSEVMNERIGYVIESLKKG